MISKKLKKLSESTIAKVLIATVVPGGFIAWGAYEIGKFIGSKDGNGDDKSSGDFDKTKDTE